MPELMGLDAVMPLDEYLKDWDVIKEIPESMLAVGRAGQDKLYSLPHMNVVMYLYCRKDMFEEAGVKYPETMDEFYEACKALTKDTNGDGVIDQYGFNLRGARGGHDMWAGLTMNCGVDYLDANGNAAFNTPEMIEANEKYINLYKEGYAPKTAPTDGFKEIIENFKAGVGAMLVHHVASSVDIVETLGDENVAVVPLPKGKGGRYVPMSPASMTVYAKTENKEEAIDYLKWINSYEQHDIICQAVGQVPFIKSVFERPAYMNNRFMAASIESLEEARMAPVVDLMGVWTEKVWPQTIQRALLGEIDSKQMIEQLAAGLQK